ncbi:hypothetical protein ACFXKW_34125 [Streptomyces sp. NPDC059193]|uniref:hypothetical protein n=1 Tax=Streptomyces sp. NPDC059193 TaxID=3346763 RepID=UPI0036D11154
MSKSTYDQSSLFVTAAIAATAVLFAGLGVGLLVWPSDGNPATSNPRAPKAATGPATATAPALSTPPPVTPSVSDAPAPRDESVPAVPAELSSLARTFVEAWSSHDARQGKDVAYSDAARRAAAYASPELADQLSASTPGTARQWKRWSDAQAQVTASVSDVLIPDGAPAPTADLAYLRVHYAVTVTPAGAQPTRDEEQVALEARRQPSGKWCVVALPFA